MGLRIELFKRSLNENPEEISYAQIVCSIPYVKTFGGIEKTVHIRIKA